MMERRLFITMLTIFSLALTAGSQEKGREYPRFTFGIEGSYTISFLEYSHLNFISSDGDRINSKALNMRYISNGQLLLNAGININASWNISLYSGYCGVNRKETLVPVTLRCTWFSGHNPLACRWMVFLDAGTGFGDTINLKKMPGLVKAGGGYRISLDRCAKLDLLVAYQGSYIHPKVYENIGYQVSGDNLRRNDSYLSALTFGIGLNF